MNNTQELLESFEIKATSSGLKIDCPADGLFQSSVAVVAEAPGEREVQARSPLVGGSGTLLWDTLRKHSITRNDCFITNVSKRQVAFDTDERRQPLGKHEFELWAELLRWELSQLPNLRTVIALGNYALKALIGHDGISQWRGSVVPVTLPAPDGQRPRMVQVVASFNPAAVLRNPKDRLIFNMDMGRVRRVIEGRWKPYNIEAIINPSFATARGFLKRLRSESTAVAYDIEIMGGETACVGFANNGKEGICINFRTRTDHRYTVEEEMVLRQEIQDVLCDPGIPLIAQNNAFDQTWLWYKDKIKSQPAWIDTMLAHHTLYPWMPHDLGFICTQYTTHPYYKDEGKSWKEGRQTEESIDTFWRYNVKDVCITWSAAHSMLKELEQQSLDKFFFGHVMRLQPHLSRMTVGGIKIDEDKRLQVHSALREELETIKEEFYAAVVEATGDASYRPNPLSTPQVSDLLFNKLKLVGRGSSTDDENRQRMYKDHRTSQSARKVLDALGKFKEEHKFFSVYIDTAVDEDGRMRCQWKQTGVSRAPGRLSSSAVLWGHYDPLQKKVVQHGTNLQNQPKRVHEMFIADEGYTLVYADGSQAEARYVGWDAEIKVWMEQFEKARLDGKYDAHRALASIIFKVPYDDVPTADEHIDSDGKITPTIRYKAKRARHALNYRMMPDRFATTAGIPIHEAQRIFETYHREHPELRRWWAKQEADARATRSLYNSFGRRLFIQGELNDPETMESIVAFRPQSTVGDHVARVIYMAEDDDRWPVDARMCLNIHDAVIALCRIEDAELCASIIKKYMETPITVRPTLPPLIIPGDVAIAEPDEYGVRRWSTLKKRKDINSAI